MPRLRFLLFTALLLAAALLAGCGKKYVGTYKNDALLSEVTLHADGTAEWTFANLFAGPGADGNFPRKTIHGTYKVGKEGAVRFEWDEDDPLPATGRSDGERIAAGWARAFTDAATKGREEGDFSEDFETLTFLEAEFHRTSEAERGDDRSQAAKSRGEGGEGDITTAPQTEENGESDITIVNENGEEITPPEEAAAPKEKSGAVNLFGDASAPPSLALLRRAGGVIGKDKAAVVAALGAPSRVEDRADAPFGSAKGARPTAYIYGPKEEVRVFLQNGVAVAAAQEFSSFLSAGDVWAALQRSGAPSAVRARLPKKAAQIEASSQEEILAQVALDGPLALEREESGAFVYLLGQEGPGFVSPLKPKARFNTARDRFTLDGFTPNPAFRWRALLLSGVVLTQKAVDSETLGQRFRMKME